ncbi:MAG: Fic family protein [Candidatus Marinamargulisbacteria bacterium]
MQINPNEPFNDLPLLPPKEEIETKAILKASIMANRKLAELKGLAETIPNQSIFINTLSLKEAQYSSEIENIITTTDELYQALSIPDKNMDSATKEVLKYKDALWKGFSYLQDRPFLTTNIITDIQAELMQHDSGIRSLPGTALKNAMTGNVIYTPPVGEQLIRDKLKNLEDYLHSEDGVDPLIKLAVMHYQFEAIHPFYDGNGRTGRILNVLYLVQQNLIQLPILYLSHHIIENKNRYYTLLREVTFKKEYEPWIMFILTCIKQSAEETILKIQSIQTLIREFSKNMKRQFPKMYSRELIDTLFQQPYCKVKFLEKSNIAKRQTGSEYLHQLERAGFLTSKKVGRENLFLNTALLELFKK